MNREDNSQLISELRDCADTLVKLAQEEQEMDKTASCYGTPASESRSEYMQGVMSGLGLEN